MKVTRSDFEIPLDEGSITCRGSVAGKKLSGRGPVDDDLVLCPWRRSRTTAGKCFRAAWPSPSKGRPSSARSTCARESAG